jgi:hypothetical protein
MQGTVTGATRVQFTGKGNDILSVEGLKMFLWYVSLAGIPIGWLYTYRWIARKTVFSDGRTVAFTGAAKQAYAFFAAFIVLGMC